MAFSFLSSVNPKKITKPKPQPNLFLGKSCVGIDLGSRALKLAAGRATPAGIEVEGLGLAVDNVRVSEQGKIGDPAVFVQLLQQAMNQSRMTSKLLLATVESTNIICRELLMPELDDVAMPGAISFEMQQYLPIDASSFVIEYRRLDNPPQGQARVWVVAVPRTIIEPYVKAFEEVGSSVFSLDTNSNAIAKLVALEMRSAGADKFADKTAMVVDMGHSYMNVMFFQNGRFLFNRILTIGSIMINQMIMRTMNIPEQQAESLKLANNRDNSLLDLVRRASELQTHPQKTPQEQIIYDTYLIINNWIYEIENVIKYYTTRDRENTLDAVYLYGGCSKIREIDSYLTRRLSIDTQIIRDMECIRFPGAQGRPDVSMHLNAISALIRK